MAKRVVEEASLVSVADSIRERAGTSEPLVFPEGFKSAVEGIPDYGEQFVDGTITEYYHPTLTNTRQYGFCYCQKLTKVVLPELTAVAYFGFQHTEAMKEFVAPKVEKIAQCGLSCSGFQVADFPRLRQIGTEGFNWTPLMVLTLRRTDEMVTLSSVNGLSNTNISRGYGYIYAPRKFLSDTDASSDYRRATNWSTYSTRFRVLEDYTVDGTTTGELDLSKI